MGKKNRLIQQWQWTQARRSNWAILEMIEREGKRWSVCPELHLNLQLLKQQAPQSQTGIQSSRTDPGRQCFREQKCWWKWFVRTSFGTNKQTNERVNFWNAQFLINPQILKTLPLGIHEENKANKDHDQVNIGGFVPGLMNAIIHRAIVTHHPVSSRHGAGRKRRKEGFS